MSDYLDRLSPAPRRPQAGGRKVTVKLAPRCRHGQARGTCGACKYPELYSVAREVVRETCDRVNRDVIGVTSKMPYKAQFVLEEVIRLLKASV